MARVFLILLSLVWLAASSPAAEAKEKPRPNFLLLFADDLGYEKLGCYGGQDVATPAIDAFASGGVKFSRAYTSPVCTPSRMSLYTGVYTVNHGFYNVLPVHLGTKKAVDFSTRPHPAAGSAGGRLRDLSDGKMAIGDAGASSGSCRFGGF